MTDHASVVQDEKGLLVRVARLEDIVEHVGSVGIRLDIAGYQDLTYAFRMMGSALATRTTRESAIERREMRVGHSRSGYPETGHRCSSIWCGSHHWG